jgi:hypothetical protein
MSPSWWGARSCRLAYFLLCFYAVIAFSLRNHQIFIDEGAALDLASCLLKGLTLYRDLFHHHLPLPVYIAAFVTHFAGVSLPSIRLCVFLLQTGVFAALVFVSRAPFPVAFAAAIWALISPYYFGNMLLYDNLAMLGGMVLGVLVFSVLARGMEASKSMFAMLAIAGIVVSLSNPFLIVATFVATGSLLFAGQIPRRFVIGLWVVIAGALAAFVLYLAANGSLQAFYADVFVFNTTIYQRYAPLDIGAALRHQLLFLDLFNPDWYRSLNPLHFNQYTFVPPFDQWLFSGFFYRAASLGACLIFALRRNYTAALFLYVFAVILPLRGDEAPHATPFVVFALFLAGVVIEESMAFARLPRNIVLALCFAPTLCLGAAGGRYLAKHAFQSDFLIPMAEARYIREAARGRDDVELGHLPEGNYMYYLTGLRPVSKFVYFYPWIAEVGRAEMDRDLARDATNTNMVLVLDAGSNVWNIPNSITLKPEILFEKQRLVRERFDWLTVYVSPAISLGSSYAEPGLYRAGLWLLGPDGPEQTIVSNFSGAPGDIPVTGDWDGGGKTKPGFYRPSDGRWLLGATAFHFGGAPDDIPVTGKWDGTGKTKIGIYRPSTGQWLLDYDGDGIFNPARDKTYTFGGVAGDVPVVGDWTGSGKSQVGIFRSGHQWMLDLDGNGRFETGPDAIFNFGGIAGDVPVTGDWTGDGKTKPGIFRQGFLWILDLDSRYKTEGPHNPPDRVFAFGGLPGDKPVTGIW